MSISIYKAATESKFTPPNIFTKSGGGTIVTGGASGLTYKIIDIGLDNYIGRDLTGYIDLTRGGSPTAAALAVGIFWLNPLSGKLVPMSDQNNHNFTMSPENDIYRTYITIKQNVGSNLGYESLTQTVGGLPTVETTLFNGAFDQETAPDQVTDYSRNVGAINKDMLLRFIYTYENPFAPGPLMVKDSFIFLNSSST